MAEAGPSALSDPGGGDNSGLDPGSCVPGRTQKAAPEQEKGFGAQYGRLAGAAAMVTVPREHVVALLPKVRLDIVVLDDGQTAPAVTASFGS